MGQNNCGEQISSYNSRDYFNEQVEFYRWRADTKTNTHICRVFFHHQEVVRDRENLKSLIENHFHTGHYISLNQILSLASQRSNQSKDQLMGFESYVCTLADLEERLSLEETLYALFCLFSGYEVLFSKLSKLKAKLFYCFLTLEGEVRTWFNRDFKSNQISEDSSEADRNCPIIASEMGLIKRILELGQRLSSNPTQFLHFSRQFRSYMERDVIQNWNFTNARKLINSYVYTYRISLPSNLKESLKKLQRSRVTTNITEHSISQFSQSQYSSSAYMPTKTDLMSTGEQFIANVQTSHGAIRREGIQRPASVSEFSSKKSEEIISNSSKTHSRKFSSTDLKHLSDRGKQYESPKMNRSQLVSQYSNKEEGRTKKKEICYMQNSYQDSSQKMRRDREYAIIDIDDKGMNTTTQLFSPVENRLSNKNSQKDSKENTHPSILKQNQFFKQKKKLQKKAAVVSKYITFYQEQRNISKNESSVPQISVDAVNQLSSEQKSGKKLEGEFYELNKNKNPLLNFVFPKQDKVCLQKRQISMDPQFSLPAYSSPVSRKPSFEGVPCNNSYILPYKGKTEHFRNVSKMEDSGDCSHFSSQNRDCFTIKTVNKLVDNNEVNQLQSNGSFMSIPQSDGSQYHGALSKMGRSVDIMNLPSNKYVPAAKKIVATSNHLGKTYNY